MEALLAGVDSIGRVESFFDAISYQKGGSIVRMMRAFLNNRRISQERYGLRRSLLQVCCSNCLCRCLTVSATLSCTPHILRITPLPSHPPLSPAALSLLWIPFPDLCPDLPALPVSPLAFDQAVAIVDLSTLNHRWQCWYQTAATTTL